MHDTEVICLREPAAQVDADALVLGIWENAALKGSAELVDQATGGLLTRLVQSQEITGKAGELETIPGPHGLRAARLVVVGLGPLQDADPRVAYRSAAAAAKSLAGKVRRRVVFYWDTLPQDLVCEAIAGAFNGCRGQDLYRQERKLHPFEIIGWFGQDQEAAGQGAILGRAVAWARQLVNQPASELYPESFADAAAEMARQHDLKYEIWDLPQLQRERCGALCAVAQGSERPPRLVILQHLGAASAQAPWIGLVGKGVTFDSGGLSLKPNDSMLTMKCDMAGAAAVVAAMQALAELKTPVNVMGLCGLAENMVSGRSVKLGDVLRSRKGTTIEVLNTDAEGRLVLADVLDVARDRGAARLIDVATLTGACMVALGTDVAGLMTNDEAWAKQVAQAAQRSGERVWSLPMFSDYGEQIRSPVADIKNVGEGRWGGAITAAKFLEEFVEGTPWVHLDIAGPAFLDHAAAWCDGGATGVIVRTLVRACQQCAS